MNVSFFCNQPTPCGGQEFFCSFCMDEGKHDHACKSIKHIVNKVSNDWVKKLIPNVNECCEAAEIRFKVIEPLVRYLEEIAKSLGLETKISII